MDKTVKLISPYNIQYDRGYKGPLDLSTVFESEAALNNEVNNQYSNLYNGLITSTLKGTEANPRIISEDAITNIITSKDCMKIRILTAEEFEAIEIKDSTTLYLITNGTPTPPQPTVTYYWQDITGNLNASTAPTLYPYLQQIINKQDILTSSNIKTIGDESILGSGNISFSGREITDKGFSDITGNPVEQQDLIDYLNAHVQKKLISGTNFAKINTGTTVYDVLQAGNLEIHLDPDWRNIRGNWSDNPSMNASVGSLVTRANAYDMAWETNGDIINDAKDITTAYADRVIVPSDHETTKPLGDLYLLAYGTNDGQFMYAYNRFMNEWNPSGGDDSQYREAVNALMSAYTNTYVPRYTTVNSQYTEHKNSVDASDQNLVDASEIKDSIDVPETAYNAVKDTINNNATYVNNAQTTVRNIENSVTVFDRFRSKKCTAAERIDGSYTVLVYELSNTTNLSVDSGSFENGFDTAIIIHNTSNNTIAVSIDSKTIQIDKNCTADVNIQKVGETIYVTAFDANIEDSSIW